MIELVDTSPDVQVRAEEYHRLLGYPRGRALSERAAELTHWARSWYGRHGRPWIYAREARSLEVIEGSVAIDGVTFSSKRLTKTLANAGADGAMLVAVSAGPEVEAEAQRLWLDEKPDEYFFLEIYGSAVVEHLVMQAGAQLCHLAETRKLAVLPHYSPGYPEWDIGQQPRLLELIRATRECALPGVIAAMESGMLRPKKSLLAVFGLTRNTERVRRLTDLIPCEGCSFSACEFRRAAYAQPGGSSAVRRVDGTPLSAVEVTVETPKPRVVPLTVAAKYATSGKALQRWAGERLTLDVKADGTVDALFRYEGTTCSNMGRSFTYHYHVTLGPRGDGYPIRAQSCAPAPGDEGHRFMCRYMNNAEHITVAIEHEKPLLGQKLDDVLAWDRPRIGAGCYCEPSSRKHKWGLVLETIHYALSQRELNRAVDGDGAETAKARRREERREGVVQ